MGRPRDVLAEQQQLLRLALQADTPSERAGSARAEAEFAAVVRHLVDEPHPHVRWHLQTALAQLSRRDQQLLRLRVAWEHPCGTVRKALGLGARFAVDQHVDTLLARLAAALWTDRGDPLVPEPAPLSRPPSYAH